MPIALIIVILLVGTSHIRRSSGARGKVLSSLVILALSAITVFWHTGLSGQYPRDPEQTHEARLKRNFSPLATTPTNIDSRWFRAFELDENNFDSEAMQMVKDDTGLVLPEGTRGLNFRYSPPIDPSFTARIEIPREAREMMLKQIESIPNEVMNIHDEPSEKGTWWPPTKAVVIIDRLCLQSESGSAYLRVILTIESGRTILYVDHAVF